CWRNVQLPERPNHSSGWLRARDVRLTQTAWRLQVELSRHRILLWRGRRLVSRHPIGVGKAVSPTPRGLYYFTDLVKPPNPNGLYGTFAFGLSAHSKVITRFGAGDGQIGIHGTNDASGLGKNVSHGCIRVADSVIRAYARHLPLGTPVVIRS
ncbi:MAG: L,D-transpeptidase, partial [Solirubrobacteraceae bacterium]